MPEPVELEINTDTDIERNGEIGVNLKKKNLEEVSSIMELSKNEGGGSLVANVIEKESVELEKPLESKKENSNSIMELPILWGGGSYQQEGFEFDAASPIVEILPVPITTNLEPEPGFSDPGIAAFSRALVERAEELFEERDLHSLESFLEEFDFYKEQFPEEAVCTARARVRKAIRLLKVA